MVSEQEVKSYIEQEMPKYNIKYKFVKKLPKEFVGAVYQVSTQTIFFSPHDLAYMANLFTSLYPSINRKEIIDHTIKHEVEHIKISKELLILNVSLSRQRLTEYGLLIEMYIQKILPEPYYIKELAHSNILSNFYTEEQRLSYNRKVLSKPLEALSVVFYLSENEIKAFFDPKQKELLLFLKSVYTNVNSIQNIKDTTEDMLIGRRIRR